MFICYTYYISTSFTIETSPHIYFIPFQTFPQIFYIICLSVYLQPFYMLCFVVKSRQQRTLKMNIQKYYLIRQIFCVSPHPLRGISGEYLFDGL